MLTVLEQAGKGLPSDEGSGLKNKSYKNEKRSFGLPSDEGSGLKS